MRKPLFFISMALCLAGCARYSMPPFSSSGGWSLQSSTVHNEDITLDFAENSLMDANAFNGEYDLNFVTSQLEFNAYDSKCSKYLSDAVKQIPLEIDSINVILADQLFILTINDANKWEPDYVRQADGMVLVVQANPVNTLIQPQDELWRNLIINKSKHQIIVVDRLIKNDKHYAVAYVLQSDSKGSPFTRCFQYDITNPRNIQPVGTYIDGLMNISVNALESNAKRYNYDDCIMKADECFMQGDYLGASNAFDNAFTIKEKIQDNHLYNSACVAAMAGLNDKAFERLNMRLQRQPDWYVEDPNRDKDLANIHSDERWQTFCDTIARRRDRIEANYDKPLMSRLRKIFRSDQDIRYVFLAAYNEQPRDQHLVDSLTVEMQKTDSINQKEICDILDTRGFVGKETVGDACAVFWLVIQHAPMELQKKYFHVFVDAMERGDISKSQVAIMDDRIAMFEQRPQKYGSQIVENEQGKRVVYQLLAPENVDEWRKEMELNPLADYMKEMGVEQ